MKPFGGAGESWRITRKIARRRLQYLETPPRYPGCVRIDVQHTRRPLHSRTITSTCSRGRASSIAKTALQSRDTICVTKDGVTPQTQTIDHKQHVERARKFFETGFKFLYSAESLAHHPFNNHSVPEIMVCGASNVGKSSLLNALVGKTDAARVSKRPGKTTLMNAYGVGNSLQAPENKGLARNGLIIMDTPGYGFKSQAAWGSNIVAYLEKRKALRGALLLLSSEKKLMSEDKWMLHQLARSSTQTLVVFTKADKIGLGWESRCHALANDVQEEVKALERYMGASLGVDMLITSANSRQLGNGGGMGGLRLAITALAGIRIGPWQVQLSDENQQYGGDVVSFDDIVWKA